VERSHSLTQVTLHTMITQATGESSSPSRRNAPKMPPLAPTTRIQPPGPQLEKFVSATTGEVVWIDRTKEKVHSAKSPSTVSPVTRVPTMDTLQAIPDEKLLSSRRSSAASIDTADSVFQNPRELRDVQAHMRPTTMVKTRLSPAFEILRTAVQMSNSRATPAVKKSLKFLEAAMRATWRTIEQEEEHETEMNDFVTVLLGANAGSIRSRDPTLEALIYRRNAAQRIRQSRAERKLPGGDRQEVIETLAQVAPSYPSLIPLPPGALERQIRCRVMVTRDIHPHISTQASLTVFIGEQDTAEALIARVLRKCAAASSRGEICEKEGKAQITISAADGLGLKAYGLEEWIIGSARITDSMYFRSCIRREDQPTMAIMRLRPVQTDKYQARQHENALKQYLDRFSAHQDANKGSRGGHKRLTAGGLFSWRCHSSWPARDCHVPFHVDIDGIDGWRPDMKLGGNLPRLLYDETRKCFRRPLTVSATLIFGEQKVLFDETTIGVGEALEWRQRLRPALPSPPCLISSIPPATRLAIVVRQKRDSETASAVVAWVVVPLFTPEGHMKQGRLSLGLWVEDANTSGPTGTGGVVAKDLAEDWLFSAPPTSNNSPSHLCKINITLPKFRLPLYAPFYGASLSASALKAKENQTDRTPLDKEERSKLEKLASSGTAKPLKSTTAALVWNQRFRLQRHAKLLPAFARSVQWSDHHFAEEARGLLASWAPPRDPSTSLQLLHHCYPEPCVRRVAVDWLQARWGGGIELDAYVLQLVQCLKNELFHESPLSRLLLSQALCRPHAFGHKFFWTCRAELDFAHPGFAERYTLILEEFVLRAPIWWPILTLRSISLVKELEGCCKEARQIGTVGQAGEALQKRLEELNRTIASGSIQMPFDPRLRVGSLRVNKCRVLSSKMKPLWLVFKNPDHGAPDVNVIFKDGDDLRQDMLMLQTLSILDRLWMSAGLDMRLTPYRVIATGGGNGRGVGMIQAVPHSATTSSIQYSEGGGAMGAFSPKVIEKYLQRHNPSAQEMAKARDNFTRSCAGYCVATFVLGVGDRHSDNIMCAKDGRLFHIDFGHVLGNFKSKFGFRRERTPFVFTPEMAFVLEGGKNSKHRQNPSVSFSNNSPLTSSGSNSTPDNSVIGGYDTASLRRKRNKGTMGTYKMFLQLAKDAFVVVRRNAVLLETLFALMVGAGLPELSERGAIQYLSDQLFLHLDDREANSHLEKMVNDARKDNYRRLDNYIHAVKHRKGSSTKKK